MDEPTQPARDRSRDATVDEAKPYIDRIDRLTEAGRVNWFGLMAYLVFAFITVLGVQDADFFDPSRQTQLPLVNVSIPTKAFFTFAPILGVALYVYLHLYVRKATGALCKAPATVDGAPIEQHVKPWLLNDMVLRWRGDGAVERKPFDWLATLTVIALIWVAGPFVLGAMWIWSWPAHSFWLTGFSGLAVALSLYVGHLSWVRLRRDVREVKDGSAIIEGLRGILLTVMVLLVLGLGAIKTKLGAIPDPFDTPWQDLRAGLTADWSRWWEIEKGQLSSLPRLVSATAAETWPVLLSQRWVSELSSARLAEVQFAALPPDQADFDAARHRFREGWCRRHDLDAGVCGGTTVAGAAAQAVREKAREKWCQEREYPEGTCKARFGELNQAFDEEWEEYRTNLRSALTKPDLRDTDLRGADLANASLTGVILRSAQIEGADLGFAQMEGADLSLAQMARANLSNARMKGVDFNSAHMEEAKLNYAQMEGADLSGVQLEGAELVGAQMEGAVLLGAQMERAFLSEAQMERADLYMALLERTVLRRARIDGANLRLTRMAGADLREAQMEGANLREARMEGADLRGARMEVANLREAQMEGADFREAQMQSVNWAGATFAASSAEFTDMRGGRNLPKGRLSSLIGNAATLLPESGDHHVCTCWKTDPPGLEHLIALFARDDVHEEELRDPAHGFFCEREDRPMRTGTPWPLDAPTPWEEAGLSLQDWMALPEQQPSVPCDPEPWAATD